LNNNIDLKAWYTSYEVDLHPQKHTYYTYQLLTVFDNSTVMYRSVHEMKLPCELINQSVPRHSNWEAYHKVSSRPNNDFPEITKRAETVLLLFLVFASAFSYQSVKMKMMFMILGGEQVGDTPRRSPS
jgi:hypothetical protein